MSLLNHDHVPSNHTWAVWRILRGLGAAVSLIGLVGGVPLALLAFTDWPITAIPTWEQIQDLPTHAASDQAIVGVFVVGLWAAWAVFTLSVAVEVVGEIRGRDAARLPAAGFLQGVARNLVASVAMTLGSVGAFSNPAPVSAAPAVAVVAEPISYSDTPVRDVQVGLDDQRPAPPTPTSTPAREPRGVPEDVEPGRWDQITVARGDSAWTLAEQHYGDGTAAHELWLDNRDQPQPDGRMWSSEEDPIREGWALRIRALPANAAATPPTPAGATVTVQPGDHFWGLARDCLTQAWGRPPTDAEIDPYWRAVIEANRDRIPPPGDPNLIHPGENYELPAPPPDPTAVAPVPPSSPAPAPSPGPVEPDSPVDQHPQPAPAPTTRIPAPTTSTPSASTTTMAPTSTTTPPRSSPNAEQTPAAPTPDPDRSSRDGGDDADWPGAVVPIGVSGVLAAMVFAALARRRRARSRSARPGTSPGPRPAGDVQTERALAITAGEVPQQLRRLNDAMTAALAALPDAPMITGVVLHRDGDIEVHVNEEIDPPHPFVAEAENIWLLAGEETDLPAATDPVPVLETLVALGQTTAGDWVLVDLESLGTLWIDGDPDSAQRLARSLITELALHPVAHVLSITVVGLDAPEDAEHHLRVVDQLDADIARDMVMNATETTRHMRRMGLPTTLAGRVQGLPRDGLVAHVVVVGPGADPVHLEKLANAAMLGGMGLALVVVNPDEPLGEDATRLHVDAGDLINIPHLGITARAASLSIEDLRRLEELLRREPDTVAASDTAPSPVRVVPTVPADPYEPPTWRFCVRVFADHQVHTPEGQIISFREDENPEVPQRNTRRGPELISYLALRAERAATFDQIRSDLWFSRPISAGSVEKLIIGTRSMLGGPEGLSMLGDRDKRYHLGPDVLTDVDLLEHVLEYAQAVAGADPDAAIDALGGILSWIEATPFRSEHLGQGLTEWATANRVVEHIEQPLITAALLLADLATDQGPEGLARALWAIDKALAACPINEALVRRAMDLEQQLGRRDAADHRYRALATELNRDELEPEEQTTDLWTEMARRSRTG